jgi:hypothetical protein
MHLHYPEMPCEFYVNFCGFSYLLARSHPVLRTDWRVSLTRGPNAQNFTDRFHIFLGMAQSYTVEFFAQTHYYCGHDCQKTSKITFWDPVSQIILPRASWKIDENVQTFKCSSQKVKYWVTSRKNLWTIVQYDHAGMPVPRKPNADGIKTFSSSHRFHIYRGSDPLRRFQHVRKSSNFSSSPCISPSPNSAIHSLFVL